MLNQDAYSALLREGNYAEIALRAVRIEARTNLIFSFEKMALRDAVKPEAGARMFATGLYDFLHGKGRMQERFERWCDVVVRFAAQTDARSYVAHCDGIRLSGAAGNTHLP
jgi:hypothetical protein